MSGFPSGGRRIDNDMGSVWLQFEVTMSGDSLDCIRSAWKVACSAGIVKLFKEYYPDIFAGFICESGYFWFQNPKQELEFLQSIVYH